MTYTSNLDPEKYRGLENLLEKITKMAPGEKLHIPASTSSELGTLRWKIYNWLFHNQLKKQFKIVTEPKALILFRKGQNFEASLVQEVLPPKLDRIFQELIPLSDPLPFLSAKLREKEITGAEVGILLEKYNNLMS